MDIVFTSSVCLFVCLFVIYSILHGVAMPLSRPVLRPPHGLSSARISKGDGGMSLCCAATVRLI